MGAMNGTELMLRSMGLGGALEGVKQLVETGAIEKIVRFVNHAEAIETELKLLRKEVQALQAVILDGHYTTPGSGPGNVVPAVGYTPNVGAIEEGADLRFGRAG